MIGALHLSLLLRVLAYIPLSYALSFNLTFYIFLKYKYTIWFSVVKVYHTLSKYTFHINIYILSFVIRNGNTGFLVIDLLLNKLIRRERKRIRRRITKLEFKIFDILIPLSPTLCYYFVLYHTLIPSILIFSIRTSTVIFNNQALILDLLYEFKILEKFLEDYMNIVGPGNRNILNETTSRNESSTSTGPPPPNPNPGGSGGGSEYVVAESSRDAIRRAEYNARDMDIDSSSDTIRGGTRGNNLYIAELAAALELEEISNENRSSENLVPVSQDNNNKGKGRLIDAPTSSNIDNEANSSLSDKRTKRVRIVTDENYSEETRENRPRKRPRKSRLLKDIYHTFLGTPTRKVPSIAITNTVTSPIINPITNPILSPITSPVNSPVTSPVTSPILSPITSPVNSPVTSPTMTAITNSIKKSLHLGTMGDYVFGENGLVGLKQLKDKLNIKNYILAEAIPDFSKSGLNTLIIIDDYLNGGKSLENNISNNKYLSTLGLKMKGKVSIDSNIENVDLSNYVKTVNHLNTCVADVENSRNKLLVRDINRVFNNYYRPGIIPPNVFESLWLENAYVFLLKSEITVNSLPDGKLDYKIKIKFTDEEQKIMSDHKASLIASYPEYPTGFFNGDVESSGEYIFELDALDFKSKVMDNDEWFSGIDLEDRPSSFSALRNFYGNQVRKVLSGDNICVLNKHNIINNPTWEYGLQDRRWFGPAHSNTEKNLENNFLKLKSKKRIPDNESFKNILTLYDEKYREFYGLPEASIKSLEELRFKYEIDEDLNKNSEMYNNLKDSNLPNYTRERLDVKSRISWLSPIKKAFFNNPFHSAMRAKTISSTVPVDPEDLYTSASAMSGHRGVKLLPANKSSYIDLTIEQDSFSELPFIKYVPWEFKIPENADGFTDDCYNWENEYCKKLVPKHRLRLFNIPEPDMTRFCRASVSSKSASFPSGNYIFSKDTLGKVFSEYEHAMKLTHEICEKIDNNNMLLYFNLFSNNCSNLCLPCADKVVIYNRELCETLEKYSDFFEKENPASKMKSTMYNYYGFYANRAWSLETSYDKLMSRLYRDMDPENVWSKVELKKEEIRDTAYIEYKYLMEIVNRDFNYAKKHNLKFDIRKTLLGEIESRLWDQNKEYNKKVLQDNYELEKRVALAKGSQPGSMFKGFSNFAKKNTLYE